MQYVDPYATKLAQIKQEKEKKAVEQDKVDDKKQTEALPSKFAAFEKKPSFPSPAVTPAKSAAPESPGQSELARLASKRSAGIQERLQALEGMGSPNSGRASEDVEVSPQVCPPLSLSGM